jgi:two-component system phosphate regulon sensor histidine kinase PhoR
MDRLSDFLALVNAAGRDGLVEVDATVLGILFDVLTCIVLLLFVLAIAGTVLVIQRIRYYMKSRLGSGSVDNNSDADTIQKLRSQLAELVHKTNKRNNYINSIFSSIEDGLMLVDPDGRVVLYNPKAMDLLGLGPEVFFPQRHAETAAIEPLASVLARCRKVGTSKQPELLELENAEGLILDVRVGPITDKYDGNADLGVLAVVKDVSELRRLENLKRDFVANVSHEFRTPLTLIAGFVEMFRMSKPLPEADRNRAFEIMELETERLKRLVSELLTLSEIENELPLQAESSFDPGEVLEGLAVSMGTLADSKGQAFQTEMNLATPLLKGNENWFYLAVKNLVENAIKYTPEGGSISLKSCVNDGCLVISVEDTGIGIAPEDQDRIFERFYRVEKARGSGSGGSGLGLALVKDITAMFDGSIDVQSEPGKGSSFMMRLPLCREGTRFGKGNTDGNS